MMSRGWWTRWGVLLCLLLAGAVDYDPNAPVTLFSAQATTGRSTVLDVRGYVMVLVNITTASGTVSLNPQGSPNSGTTWITLTCSDQTGSTATAYTATGMFRCNVAGFDQFSLNLGTCTGCSVTATGTALAGGVPSPTGGGKAVPGGLIVMVDSGTCPTGYTEVTAMAGFYPKVLVGVETLGSTVGTALTASENRAAGQHTHGDPLGNVASVYVSGSGVGITGSGGGATVTTGNGGLTAGTNVPYYVVRFCKA